MSQSVLHTNNKSLSYLVQERRERPRTTQSAKLVCTVGQRSVACPVIEMPNYGARIVLDRNTIVDQKLEVRVTTPQLYLKGKARVAWTSPMSNGCTVVGLEFLEVRRSFGA